MPANVRLLVGFVLMSVTVAIAGIVTIYAQDDREARVTAEQLTGGSVQAGKSAFQGNGCGACHAITGVAGADGQVGPALSGVATRAMLAGKVSNTPSNMVAFLRQPQAVLPGGAMPNLNVSERDAHNIAAYLYTLR